MTSKDLFINKENLIKSETPDQNSIKIHSIKGLSDPKKKMNINMTPKNSSIQSSMETLDNEIIYKNIENPLNDNSKTMGFESISYQKEEKTQNIGFQKQRIPKIKSKILIAKSKKNNKQNSKILKKFIKKTKSEVFIKNSNDIQLKIFNEINDQDIIKDFQEISSKCNEDLDFINLNSNQNPITINQYDLQLICDEKYEDEPIEIPIVNENIIYDEEIVDYLIQKENNIDLDLKNLIERHPGLNWWMRAILIDWIMHFSTDFQYKRSTVYVAIHYLDRFLTSTNNLQKEKLQLVGITSLYIACKLEEVLPQKIEYFSINSGYPENEIIEMEFIICKTLKFYLNPSVIPFWVTFYMKKWDLFISKNLILHENISKNLSIPLFNKENEASYILFRQVFQILDCCILDTNTLIFNQRGLVLTCFYLILGCYYNLWNQEKINQEFCSNSKVLENKEFKSFNFLFNKFSTIFVGVELKELLAYIHYLSNFFKIIYNYDVPPGEFEKYYDFLLAQTYNPGNLEVIRTINSTIT